MIDPLANTRIWVAAGFTDMRCGFDGLAAKVQTVLAKDPFSGHIFVFRGKRGDLIKCLYWRDAYACSPNAWSAGALRGLVLTAVLFR